MEELVVQEGMELLAVYVEPQLDQRHHGRDRPDQQMSLVAAASHMI
jgi:hypothetical protein